MATILEDLDCQGNAACNDLTVRGRLTVNGVPAGAGVAVQDEGVAIANNPHTTLNFVGTPVTAADAGGGVATVTIAPAVNVQDEGVAIANNPHTTLNFVGVGVTATDAGSGVATVTIPGAVSVQDEGTPLAGDPHTTLNFVGNGVAATDAGSGVATVTVTRNAALFWGAGDINNAADDRFLAPGNIATAPTTDTLGLPNPFIGSSTARCLYVRHNTTAGNGQPVVYTLFKNGVATALTCSLVTGAIGNAHDVTHNVTFAQNDVLSLQAHKAADIGSGALSVFATLVLD